MFSAISMVASNLFGKLVGPKVMLGLLLVLISIMIAGYFYTDSLKSDIKVLETEVDTIKSKLKVSNANVVQCEDELKTERDIAVNYFKQLNKAEETYSGIKNELNSLRLRKMPNAKRREVVSKPNPTPSNNEVSDDEFINGDDVRIAQFMCKHGLVQEDRCTRFRTKTTEETNQ